jgi:hypothetical protein
MCKAGAPGGLNPSALPASKEIPAISVKVKKDGDFPVRLNARR